LALFLGVPALPFALGFRSVSLSLSESPPPFASLSLSLPLLLPLPLPLPLPLSTFLDFLALAFAAGFLAAGFFAALAFPVGESDSKTFPIILVVHKTYQNRFV
jgi:hypothetical protein